MRVSLLLFAQCRETVGREKLTLALAKDSGIPELWSAIEDVCPALLRFRPHVRVSVNRQFVREDARLQPGDEVALIPPVSGG